MIALVVTGALAAVEFNVRDYGAKGDGVALDSPAINAAIQAASDAGGGVVRLPAGRYLSFSIRLKSRLVLEFDPGAVLVAATPSDALGRYDEAEPNKWGDEHAYQDFGHSHWRNSLIWGDGVENVTVRGPGLIDGTGALLRNIGGPRHGAGPNGTPSPEAPPESVAPANRPPPTPPGSANKAIALKNCRHVTLRDLSVLNAGHFALLATGVDHLTLDNLKIDTNRDGFDIDACRNVRVTNCSVNTPNDDAIVLKSSFALGEARATENVTISNCLVSGYDVGSLLDGTFRRTVKNAPDRDGPTGRIKFGTESNGGFKNITITNCVFDRSRGLALETVDGGVIEDVVISNLVMRDVSNSVIFLRLGNRARGPAGTPVGAIRRVKISQVSASDVDGRFPILLAGLPGHPIEEVTLSDIHVVSRGGVTLDHVAQQPAELVNAFFLRGREPGVTGPREPFAVPLRETAYPEPSMFGLLPASAIYARHVRGLVVRDFRFEKTSADGRPLVLLEQVSRVRLADLVLPDVAQGDRVILREVDGFTLRASAPLPDVAHDAAVTTRL